LCVASTYVRTYLRVLRQEIATYVLLYSWPRSVLPSMASLAIPESPPPSRQQTSLSSTHFNPLGGGRQRTAVVGCSHFLAFFFCPCYFYRRRQFRYDLSARLQHHRSPPSRISVGAHVVQQNYVSVIYVGAPLLREICLPSSLIGGESVVGGSPSGTKNHSFPDQKTSTQSGHR
jgi:hypothetical protein